MFRYRLKLYAHAMFRYHCKLSVCVACFIMAKSYMRVPSLDIAEIYMLMFC